MAQTGSQTAVRQVSSLLVQMEHALREVVRLRKHAFGALCWRRRSPMKAEPRDPSTGAEQPEERSAQQQVPESAKCDQGQFQSQFRCRW